MVLLESVQLGHTVFIKSYCKDLRTFAEAKIIDKFEALFNYVADVCFEFSRVNCKFPTPGNSRYLVAHMTRIMDTYIQPHRPVENEEDEPVEHELPKDFDEKLSNALIFAAIWGIGAVIEETTRPRFDEFLQQVLNADEVIETHNLDLGLDDDGNVKSYEPAKIPNKIGGEYKSLFELYFDQEEMRWVNWTQTVEKYTINKEHTFLQLSIPTIDMIRVNHLCKSLLNNNLHALLIGPTGTGKSMSIMNLLKKDFDNTDYTYYTLGFSAQTSANQTELIIDGSMEKKKRGVFGPSLGRKGIIFVDDLNMPQKEQYGAQPPIELLRQYMDYGGWYDIENPEREFRALTNCRFIAAMSRNTITSRYIRHFNTIYCEPYSADSLSQIFSTILDWMFASSTNPVYGQPITALKDNIVSHTITVFNETCA
jgi:dynein heavy chain